MGMCAPTLREKERWEVGGSTHGGR
jgi:hypothetical protein